jgi:hypothetical protein
MQARLEYVRDMTYRLEEVEGRTGLTVALLRHWREEERALEDALVGDDPLVLAGVDYLRRYYEESDLVLRTERGAVGCAWGATRPGCWSTWPSETTTGCARPLEAVCDLAQHGERLPRRARRGGGGRPYLRAREISRSLNL